MTLSDLSIKNPVFAWMLMLGLIVFGWMGFTRMGISQLPDVDFPVVTVQVSWEGAAPEVMETEVTDVIEDSVMSIEGIKEVSSTSRQGQAMISVEFELDKDIDVAVQEIQSRLSQARRQLPPEMDPPVIFKTNPEDQPIMWLSLSGDRPLRDLMEYVKDHLKDQVTTVSGVGEVFLGGYVEPNLRVWLDAGGLAQREITVDDVISAIRNQHEEVPAGRIETPKQEFNLRVMGEASSVEEFRGLIIPQRSGSPIWKTFRIGDVAQVEDGLDDARRISRYRGMPSVGLGVKKQRGANAVQVARAVKKKVAGLQERLPEGMKLVVVFDGTAFVEESTSELVFTLILSALLTGVVCWLFLGSWSATVNVLLAIPTSVIGAFIVLHFMGFTLNTFTLLGLTLVIGIVVDDAIMVLENIVRHREAGLPRVKAALVGAREISFAAMAASVAILAIFLPVVFMKGIMGRFFYQFGVTMSAAVMLSLLEALTLAPMRCSQFLETGHTGRVGRSMDGFMHACARGYRRALGACLSWRWTVIGLSLAIFAGSLGLVKSVRKEFVPPQDQSRLLVRLQTPVGSSLQFTDEVCRKAEEFFAAQELLKGYYVAIGGFGGGEVNTAMMFLTLKPRKERPVNAEKGRPLTQQEFMPILRKGLAALPGVEKAIVQDLSLSGFTAQRGFPVEFTLRGSDWDTLAELSGKMMGRLRETNLVTDVDSDYTVGMPEVRVLPHREKAARRGVSVASIANTINATIGGVRVGKYTRGGKRYDIRVRLVSEDRRRPRDIRRIFVRNNRGEVVSLAEVVDIQEKPTPLSISRRNRQRSISIFANVAPGQSQAEALAAVPRLAKDLLPEGYELVLSGSAQTFKESFASLNLALVLGIFVAYMVLGAQFNSFIHPFTVLLAMPFSVTGALIALRTGDASLNIYSMIGIILLMGIVKKNSILLVDFTNERRKGGLGVREALLEACPIRLRPILMTSVSTIAAAIPPALALGPGAEARIPMAIVVIGGIIASTLLTLFVVPCAYSLLSRLESHRHDRDLKEALRELGELKVGEKA